MTPPVPSDGDSPLVISNVGHRYGTRRVLEHVSLTIPRGSVVGLIGSNGSGKSTLLHLTLGLLELKEGDIGILNERPATLSAEAKSRLGFVAQQIRLYPWMTVEQITLYFGAFYDKWDPARAEHLSKMWQLSPGQRVSKLSGGELQKLALILALGHSPELLILDEPVSNLDPLARRQFLELLIEYVADGTRSVLFSTHILSDLERVVSHIALLQNGRIACFDELDVIKDRYKRLRVLAAAELPQTFAVAGAFNLRIDGRDAQLTVPNVSPALVASIEQDWQAQVTIEDLNLEEIFMELHHG